MLTHLKKNQPHVPPSWKEAGAGLIHSFDEGKIKREIMLLHRAIAGSNSSRERTSLRDDLSAIISLCSKIDIGGDFANLHRVQCAGSSLWTTPSGAKKIEEACSQYDVERSIRIQVGLESKLKAQEHLIKQLQAKVETMTRHEELDLNVPASETTNDEKKEAHS